MRQHLEYLPALIVILIISAHYILDRKKQPKTLDVLDGLDMNFLKKLSLRLRILETNYGRDAGWLVEDEGRQVALLTEPWFLDMFWESYHITVLSEAADERERILTSDDFWRDRPLVYTSRGFGMRAEFAFSSGLTEPGCVAMRGLYLPVRYSSLERLILWLQKLLATKQPG